MATPKAKKKSPAKKIPAKKAKPQVDVVELALHYSKTCCSLDYEQLVVIEEHYSSFELKS